VFQIKFVIQEKIQSDLFGVFSLEMVELLDAALKNGMH
jgi:hypothetical protein